MHGYIVTIVFRDLAAPTYWLQEATRHALMPEGDEPRRADLAQAMSSAWLYPNC